MMLMSSSLFGTLMVLNPDVAAIEGLEMSARKSHYYDTGISIMKDKITRLPVIMLWRIHSTFPNLLLTGE